MPCLPTYPIPSEFIYHSIGGTAGGFSFSGKPSNRRICHLHSIRDPSEGIVSPFCIFDE